MLRRPSGGGWAVVAFAMAVGVVAVAGAGYRSAIDYAGDPRAAAIRAFANGDSRYLAIEGLSFSMEGEPIDPLRDLRRVRAASEAQQAYVARYNETMRAIVSAKTHGRSIRRPRPLPRRLFALELVLV